jgi:Asp/Glu/hydantoin racemase
MAAHGADCDAVVVAVSWDTAVRAGRELLGVPVVGITEAALVTGAQLGGRFGFVSFDARSRALYEELVAGYGYARAGSAWRVVASRAAFAPGDTAALEDQIVAAVEAMVAEDRIEVAILTGAVMAGVARRLQPRARIPLLDGVTCGVLQAEALVSESGGRGRGATRRPARGKSSASIRCWRHISRHRGSPERFGLIMFRKFRPRAAKLRNPTETPALIRDRHAVVT